ncbi:hypothetical protein [Microcoleus sp. Pol12B5]|uniref:hypothetical protein n=1 Tax=Microcoleus sp. Pol12B5 TaxID=3055396 RepID=UPI002FD3D3A5
MRLLLEQPQAIFIDIRIPNLTEFEVWEGWKCDRTTCQIPAIVMNSKHFGLHHFFAVRDARNAR